jgi:16S rRNA (adenine1518-N6/adenine1519-N6)-dimethyltransferase
VSMELTNICEIKELLRRHGFRFSKSLGQNFLTAAWVPENIAEKAGIDENSGVLEIGPGIGCLTKELSKRAGKVLAVELDKTLKPVLAETLADCGNVELIFGNILEQDIRKLAEEHFEGLRPAVCANLPYNVTTPVLTALIKSEVFDSITVMIQREVARRICAPSNTAEYGAFSLLVQWYTEPELLFDVSADCFIPRPKVSSSVIRLARRTEAPVEVKDEKLLFKVIRAAFGQRRKTLANALSAGTGIERAAIEAIIVSCGISPQIRGEALNIQEFAAISDKIYDKTAKKS